MASCLGLCYRLCYFEQQQAPLAAAGPEQVNGFDVCMHRGTDTLECVKQHDTNILM
jgi:hypothetical protein